MKPLSILIRELSSRLALGLGAAALAATGCARQEGGRATAEPPGAPLPPGAVIETVRRVVEPARVEVPGTIESEVRVQISAKIPAHVRRVHVSAGSAVREGQVLIELDDREIREQLTAAEAQARQAETEYERVARLRADGAATEQQLLAAETARDAARAQVERVRVMLSYATLVSPITGIVTDRRIEEGDLAGPGHPLLAVYDPTRLRIEAAVPSRLIRHLRVGQPVDVAIPNEETTRRAIVTEIVSEIDPATRTQKVRAKLEDPTGLLPGAFARLIVEADPVETITVSESALRRVGQLETVEVVRDGRRVRRLVRTGARRAGRVEILAGLEDGEQIVAGAREE